LVGTRWGEDARGTVPSGKWGMAVGGASVMVGRVKVDTTDFLTGAMFGFLDLTGFLGLEDVVTLVVGVVETVCFESVAMPF
jgi:hypothetical protein